MEPSSITLNRAFANGHITSASQRARQHETIFQRNGIFVGHDCDLAETGAFFIGYVAGQAVFATHGAHTRHRGMMKDGGNCSSSKMARPLIPATQPV